MLTMNILCSKFANLRPGQSLTLGSYVAKPKSSVWFHIEHLDAIRKHLKHNGLNVRVKFRGPRYDMMRAYTKKADAKFFSVYWI